MKKNEREKKKKGRFLVSRCVEEGIRIKRKRRRRRTRRRKNALKKKKALQCVEEKE